LSRVGDKWSLLVVEVLSDAPKRFNDLRRSIEGISQRMLALTLRGLERDGLIAREVRATVPPSVEYSLTKVGATLRDPVRALASWATNHRLEIQGARSAFDERDRKLKLRKARLAARLG
jgi:DNA-binding HxlR family transcriptional regulator